MKSRPIHQNLDTSFVNLSALVKYLRRRQFVGCVKIQLNGYQAEIHLKEDNQLSVREHDKISGRIADGEEAFQRLLIRAREPGGSINVYQAGEPAEAVKPKPKAAKPEKKVGLKKKAHKQIVDAEIVEISIPNSTEVSFQKQRQKNADVRKNGYPKGHSTSLKNSVIEVPKIKNPAQKQKSYQPSLPDFPFELTNSVEQKALSRKLAVADWQALLKITVELLGVVDKTLAKHRLDFTAAFTKARSEIAADYPFLNPDLDVFDYDHGRISMKEQVNETIFVNSISEALGRILEKLAHNPKFSNINRDTSHLIIALINKRKPHYDRFGFTGSLERILGL
jgi:hypothetical protein